MMKQRSGLTMLEVIFSMVVILVGLVSIAFLIPLAGREAEDSQQITQGLAAGESALALFYTTNVAQPTMESPWCLIDDVNLVENTASTMQNVYEQAESMRIPRLGAPQNAAQATQNQNEIAGTGFCIDPLFWGYQQPGATSVPTPFFRTLFPFLFDGIDPITMSANQSTAPRLIRGSLTSPLGVAPGSWLRQPAAVRLATMYGGDLVQPETSRNKAIGPLRSVYVGSDGSVLSTPTANQQATWMTTITPAENTPVIPVDRVAQVFTGTTADNRPIEIPRKYDVALVVFSKRDVRDVNSILVTQSNPPSLTPVINNLPTSERVVKVTKVSDDAINSGAFNIEVSGYQGMDLKIAAGDWLMMSRFARRDLIPRPTGTFRRQIHRWYRIIGVTSSGSFPLVLRVAGKPWDWTEGEITDLIEKGGALPTLPPSPSAFETQAVILKDVVQVYERQMELR